MSDTPTSDLAPIEEAIAAIARGEMVVVVDDEDRENEGDLIMAAESATPEKMAFFLQHTSGVICTSVTAKRAERLELQPMVEHNTESMGTAFTVTVDYRPGLTTGISAYERAATINALASPTAEAADFTRPGHIFPLIARDGGVLRRAGHTEAAVDLARMAGLQPAGVLCEIVDDKKLGMARLPELRRFAREHDLLLISIADLIRYRRRTEKLVRYVSKARIPTQYGDFTAHVYESVLDGEQHVALVQGEINRDASTLVRVHSECLTGDIFGSLRCDCGVQLDAALQMISAEGTGVLLYLRGHEGRGIGLGHKIHAYSLQDEGQDTVDANLALGLPVDNRKYGIGAQILNDLGVTTMRLITNNPAKRGGLQGFGLEIVERVPAITAPNPENIRYLRTKRDRMGHLLDGLDDEAADEVASVTELDHLADAEADTGEASSAR